MGFILVSSDFDAQRCLELRGSEAYVVFETRAGRDRALSTLSQGFSFRGSDADGLGSTRKTQLFVGLVSEGEGFLFI